MANRVGKLVRGPRPAFTLVELLIVIGIITILIVLGMSVAHKVSGSGRIEATKQTLRVLDSSLTEYISVKGEMPPAWVVDPRPNNANGATIQPVADAKNISASGPDQVAINSVGLYMAQCKSVPSVDAIFKQLDARLIKLFDPDSPGNDNDMTAQTSLSTVMDAWGRPIRYVHPVFKGLLPEPPGTTFDVSTVLQKPPGKNWGFKDILRDTTPGPTGTDGGIPQGNRPYFYSAGPDGDPTTTDDNVYISVPRFQKP